ncbi:hypothetical protein P43SY_009529 [Pythium insidiosum]|uniref:Uncharacterized protein n=1 Tax=Pythium insidiosum TaxID=114742 RepID=A0AAD5QA69_PYTIN|nr:hypothetical protein P43SY_009529 [Pythium insidiosum]
MDPTAPADSVVAVVLDAPPPRSPVKLTPLDKKARDRQRQRDQAERRRAFLKARDDEARALQLAQRQSSRWHERERQEEELVLKQLERDVVDPQKLHPAAAGYRFVPEAQTHDATRWSPVFQGHAVALCASAAHAILPMSTAGRRNAVVPGAVVHPAFHGHAVARNDDATRLSPVFFFLGAQKIPLDEIGGDDDSSDSEGDDEDDEQLARLQFQARATRSHAPTIATLSVSERAQLEDLRRSRFVADAVCLVCRGGQIAGCPGCFTFDRQQFRRVQSAATTQRLKTPKTQAQEREAHAARHRALHWKLLGLDPAFRSRPPETAEPTAPPEDGGANSKAAEDQARVLYYTHVMADIPMLRKHRSVMMNYVSLHIKTLPLGTVDVRASIAYVYELYRANIAGPNRKIHLLLPTAHGIFYLSELVETASDARLGCINGEFLVLDFGLQASSSLAAATEFLLFSVAVLHPQSTPQLVANYLQQNFHLAGAALRPCDELELETATARLPPSLARDPYQRHLVPHVRAMKAQARTHAALERLETERERERLLWLAYLERKQARLELKRRRNAQRGEHGPRSRKVVRAMAYLAFCLDSTSNPRRPNVVFERLERLWQCFQWLEEHKLCRHGRLLDAESTPDTRALVQQLQDAAVAAFDSALARGPGAGPLLQPVVAVGSSASRRLAVKIGQRMGCSPEENVEYGLLLDLDEQEEAEEDAVPAATDGGGGGGRGRRGMTRRERQAQAEADARQREAAATWRCTDVEWKAASVAGNALLFTGTDLLRPPFCGFPWHRVVHAYKHALQSLAFQLAQLDAFNALARVLQQPDAKLGKAQIERWSEDAERFLGELMALSETTSPLLKGSALVAATRRVLLKNGARLLRRRLQQRRKRLREREAELERLQRLQEELATPKLTLVQQLKRKFVVEQAPKILATLELTPAEKLRQKAGQLLGAVAAKATTVAQAAKKEYQVRAL